MHEVVIPTDNDVHFCRYSSQMNLSNHQTMTCIPEFVVSREVDADIHAVCPETYWYFLSALVDAHGYTYKSKL